MAMVVVNRAIVTTLAALVVDGYGQLIVSIVGIVVVSERLAAGIRPEGSSNVDSSHIRMAAPCRFLPVSDVIRCILRIPRLPMWSDRVNMIPR